MRKVSLAQVPEEQLDPVPPVVVDHDRLMVRLAGNFFLNCRSDILFSHSVFSPNNSGQYEIRVFAIHFRCPQSSYSL